MIKPSCLLVWPLHLDFPVCRWNLERFQDYFNGIYIGFSQHHIENQDLSNFIRSKLPFAHFVEIIRTRDDWRDDAVNCLLDVMPKDGYVCFLEQDFLIKDKTFFEKVFRKEHPFMFYQEDQRIHPAFSVVRRDLVDKTSRNFAVCPPGDHFYQFFNELPFGINIEDLDVHKREDYYHMAGLSQNYMNYTYEEPFFHPNNFLYYNYKSLQFPNQHPLFNSLQQGIERKYGHPEHHAFLNNFFPEI
ncbi:MAG: hypothetical protein C5B43_04160 [Verrucomicrobia bacterium]|nr:MAG: hypothetical protein C5B43_04160 [Verrucomicrobiota bacterium]